MGPLHLAIRYSGSSEERVAERMLGNAWGEPEFDLAASPSTEACNLWTQGLHANRIEAPAARPETDNIGRLATIGLAIGTMGKRPQHQQYRPMIWFAGRG